MSEILHAFNFNGREIKMFGTIDQPEWLAKDICRALGYLRPSNAMRMVPEEEKGARSVSTPGGMQVMTTVKEAGLYRLIFGSAKAEAEDLRAKTFNEVLPSIRKTGSYSAKPMTPAQIALQQAQALVDFEQKQIEHEERLNRAALCLKDMSAKVEGMETMVSQRLGRSTIQDDEVTSKAIAELLGWLSSSDKLHSKAVSQIAKDRGFIRRGLARMADYWDDSAGWVHSIVFTPKGVKAFELEIDRPFVGADEFEIQLSSKKTMHIHRQAKAAA